MRPQAGSVGRLNRAPDLGLDRVDRLGGVERGHELLALEQLEDRRGLLVVVAQPGGQRLRVVVLPDDQLRRRTRRRRRAPSGRWAEEVVVEPAAGAQPAGQHALGAPPRRAGRAGSRRRCRSSRGRTRPGGRCAGSRRR